MLEKKICMLGTLAVGKTSLVRRFIEGIYSESYQTSIGVKVDKKNVRGNGQEVKLVLWDIYGDDRFQKVQAAYWRGMFGYLLVVDGTRRNTLEDALALNQRVTDTGAKVPALLIVNKADLADQWQIGADRLAQLAESGWEIFRTSAKTGENVDRAFSRLTSMMLGK
ncbi:MAG: Rab family GTPase [Candidatus Acidiferrales bacterium]